MKTNKREKELLSELKKAKIGYTSLLKEVNKLEMMVADNNEFELSQGKRIEEIEKNYESLNKLYSAEIDRVRKLEAAIINSFLKGNEV